MDMTIQAIKPQERFYCHPQSSQIAAQTACIGYLLADVGEDGNDFRYSWNDGDRKRKTDDFKEELNDVINTLRISKDYGGILKSRAAMYDYCFSHPEAGLDESRDYGFRVDTPKYTYMLRLTPSMREDSLCCCCYERRWLDDHIREAARARAGANVVFSVTPDEGYHVRAVSVTTSRGKAVEVVENADGTSSFKMPSSAVTVSAKFYACPSLEFADLDVNEWYYEHIDYVFLNGVMDGAGNGNFEPETIVTRAQMDVILYRYEQKVENGGFAEGEDFDLDFPDADDIDDWALEASKWCVRAEVIEGRDDGAYDPTGSAERCEMATVLAKYLRAE